MRADRLGSRPLPARPADPGPPANVSRLSLYQLDRVLEVSIPWSDLPLILAPGCRIARDLRARSTKPGRVWCVCEVLDLLLAGISPEDAQRVAEAKLVFDGSMGGVRLIGEQAARPAAEVK